MDAQEKAKNWHAGQLQFIDWLALPKKLRKPRTQDQLAKIIGYDPATLSDWKKLPGFMDDVRQAAKTHLKNDVPEIFDALAREAKAGDVQAIKLALEVTGEYIPAQKVDATVNGVLTWKDAVESARHESSDDPDPD